MNLPRVRCKENAIKLSTHLEIFFSKFYKFLLHALAVRKQVLKIVRNEKSTFDAHPHAEYRNVADF